MVKNITDFGVFVDLNGMDGLLPHHRHVLGPPQPSFRDGRHRSRARGQILEVNREKERVSLGLKQLQNNPWENIEGRYPWATRSAAGSPSSSLTVPSSKWKKASKASSTSPSSPGRSALPVRPMCSPSARSSSPSFLASTRDERKISLGVRQLEPNPWDDIDTRYPVGTKMTRPVRNLTAYGAFVELEEGIDGMIHVSDLSWTRKINHPSEMLKKGQEVEAVVLGIDKANQRISPRHEAARNRSVERDRRTLQGRRRRQGSVSKIASFGAFVELEDDIDGLVHISQISEERIEKVKDKLNVGDEVEARVIKVDKVERRIGLSIKAMSLQRRRHPEAKAPRSKPSSSPTSSASEQAFKFATEEWRPGRLVIDRTHHPITSPGGDAARRPFLRHREPPGISGLAEHSPE